MFDAMLNIIIISSNSSSVRIIIIIIIIIIVVSSSSFGRSGNSVMKLCESGPGALRGIIHHRSPRRDFKPLEIRHRVKKYVS